MSKESGFLRPYFAYGERTPKVLGAIIGRDLEVESSTLYDHRLYIQRSSDVDPAVRDILGEPRTLEELDAFRAYVAVPEEGSHIKGAVTELSPSELDLVDYYDINGLWFVRRNGLLASVGQPKRLARVSAHILAFPASLDTVPSYEGRFPEPLNDVGRTLEIARGARTAFLAEQK